LRRLFSNFARGWPGVGILLLRVGGGTALVSHSFLRLVTGLPIKSASIEVFAIAVGLSLFVGFWTPIAGFFVMLFGVWDAFLHSGDPWRNILLATIGLALALVGPGAFSVDARLFGWKRIDIRDRKT
jgi:putative oxidoreductase